jgi:hypothetical protein
MTTFTLNGKQYQIKLTYSDAKFAFPHKFDLHLLALFEDNNLDRLLTQIMLNDELSLSLMAHYVEDKLDETALYSELDQDPSALQRFKQAWWDALLAFYGPLQRNVLKQVLEGAPSLIKKQVSQSLLQGLNSGSSSIEEKQELESNSTTKPLE